MFTRLLAGKGFDFRTWRVVDGEFPDSVTDAEGWLITGSKHGVYEDHAFIAPLEQFVRDAFAARVPVAASASATRSWRRRSAARSRSSPAAGPSAGHRIRFRRRDADPERLAPGPGGRAAAAARVIASTPFCAYAGFAYDDRGSRSSRTPNSPTISSPA
jgi:hypothetical protein